MRKILLFLVALLLSGTSLFAQSKGGVDMADALYASGRIYVVIIVIAIVFVGLAIYLFSIDRRLKKIEREN